MSLKAFLVICTPERQKVFGGDGAWAPLERHRASWGSVELYLVSLGRKKTFKIEGYPG